jgi:hypothetical protein
MSEQTGIIKTRNFIIRDTYKQRWLREKSVEKEKERKNKTEILNRSAIRFSSSPFAVNFVGLEEISEYNRNFDKKVNKHRKPLKPKRKISETRDQKFLRKLRNEVKVIENSKNYTDEKKLEAALNEKHIFSSTYEFVKSKNKITETEGSSFTSKNQVQGVHTTNNSSNSIEASKRYFKI